MDSRADRRAAQAELGSAHQSCGARCLRTGARAAFHARTQLLPAPVGDHRAVCGAVCGLFPHHHRLHAAMAAGSVARRGADRAGAHAGGAAACSDRAARIPSRARQRRDADQVGRIHLRRLHPLRHGDRQIYHLRAGDRQRPIAGARRSVASDGRGNRVCAGAAAASLAGEGSPGRSRRRGGGSGCGV